MNSVTQAAACKLHHWGHDRILDIETYWIVLWWSCVKDGSRLMAEPATQRAWGKSGAGWRSTSAGCFAVCQAGEVPCWGIAEAVRGEEAELVCVAVGGTKVSGLWVCVGVSCNSEAKESNCGALWSSPGFILGFCPAGVRGSVDLVLLPCTLEHVCKWVKRPRYDRNLVRQLSHLQRQTNSFRSSFGWWI